LPNVTITSASAKRPFAGRRKSGFNRPLPGWEYPRGGKGRIVWRGGKTETKKSVT